MRHIAQIQHRVDCRAHLVHQHGQLGRALEAVGVLGEGEARKGCILGLLAQHRPHQAAHHDPAHAIRQLAGLLDPRYHTGAV